MHEDRPVDRLGTLSLPRYYRAAVWYRTRPVKCAEQARQETDVVTVPNKETVIVHEPKQKVDLTKYLDNQTFYFDYAFDETSDNDIVYRSIVISVNWVPRTYADYGVHSIIFITSAYTQPFCDGEFYRTTKLYV